MPARRTGLAAARRIVAGAFLFAGLFVLCFGLGNGRQAVMVAGAAITVLAFGARVATNLRRSPRRWVQGTGHVLEVSEPPPTDARFGRTAIELVVDVPGLPRETVTIHDSRVPVGQWPASGQELPIQVAADDLRNLRVLWRNAAAAGAAAEAGWDEEASREEPPGWEESGPDQPPAEDADGIDFDLDGPPTVPLGPLPAEPPGPEPTSPVAPVRRVPRPRPRRRRPEPVPAGAVATAPTGPAGTGDPVDDLVTTYPSAHPGPAGAINGVGVTVLVADLERSVEFYRDRLGFYEVDGGEGSVVLASGETRLVLRQAPDLGTGNRRLVHLNLEVSDIDAMYAELKGNGVRFLYPPRAVSRSARLELWAAAFRDPDGHGIALTQWRSP